MNNQRIIQEFDNAIIYYNESHETLFLEYTSEVDSHEQFIEINFNILSAFKKLNTYKFAVDVRKLGFIGIDSQKWISEVLLPGMISHLNSKLLYHLQLIDPSEAMSKIAATGVKLQADDLVKGFQVEQFTDSSKMEERLQEV